MAPIHESVVELSATSPLMVTFLVAMVSLAVLASLLVAALVCACGKRKEQPTVGEEPREDLQPPPEEEPVVMGSSKPQDEAKSAKTAVEGPSRSERSAFQINPDKAPVLQLTSQKPAPEGISAVGNMKPTDRAPSLQLTGSPDSSSVQPEKGSETSLKSKTVGSKKPVESRTVGSAVGVQKVEPKAVLSRTVGSNVIGAKPVGDKTVGSRTVGSKVVGKHSVLIGA